MLAESEDCSFSFYHSSSNTAILGYLGGASQPQLDTLWRRAKTYNELALMQE